MTPPNDVEEMWCVSHTKLKCHSMISKIFKFVAGAPLMCDPQNDVEEVWCRMYTYVFI